MRAVRTVTVEAASYLGKDRALLEGEEFEPVVSAAHGGHVQVLQPVQAHGALQPLGADGLDRHSEPDGTGVGNKAVNPLCEAVLASYYENERRPSYSNRLTIQD